MQVLDAAPFGMVSLETTLGMVGTKLVKPGYLDWTEVIRKLSTNPAKILRLTQKGSLAIGSDADVTIFDPDCEWTVDTREFRSKSSNTPLNGWTLHGRATDVIVGGQIRKRSGDTN